MRYLSIEILRSYAREKANIGIVWISSDDLSQLLVNVVRNFKKHSRDNVSKKANIGIAESGGEENMVLVFLHVPRNFKL